MKTTKIINIFDTTPRDILCIATSYDYLGDGSLIVKEDVLTIGTVYHAVDFKKESYGEFVSLDGYDSSHGFNTSLFEELEAYDISKLQKEYQAWLHNTLAEGVKSMEEGKSISIAIDELRKKLL